MKVVLYAFLGLLLCASGAHANRLVDVENAAFFGPATFLPPTGGDPTVGLLPAYNDLYANWSNAGLQSIGGIPNRSTQCGSTLTPNGTNDTTQINNAITACTAGQVVQLGSGTFKIPMAGFIFLNKGVTLRGTGSCTGSNSVVSGAYVPICSTIITQSDGLTHVNGSETCAGGACSGWPVILMAPSAFNDADSWSWSDCSRSTWQPTSCGGTVANLTVDAAQGDSTVTVNTTAPFSVGMYVLIDEDSGGAYRADTINNTSPKQVWASSDFSSSSGSPATGRVVWAKHNPSLGGDDFSSIQNPSQSNTLGCGYSPFCGRVTNEIKKITAIGTGTLTFESPLTIAYRTANTAHVYYPTTSSSSTAVPFLAQAGVENVSITRGNGGDILAIFCAYCWAKNVDASQMAAGAVEMQADYRFETNTVYGHDCWNNTNNGNEYPFDMMDGTTESMITNSISRGCGKNMTVRAAGAGSVVSYNYYDDEYYGQGSGLEFWVLDASINGSHYAGSHGLLFEGNWGVNFLDDHQHGNNVYHTYYRNYAAGYRTPWTDPQSGTSVNDFTGAGEGAAIDALRGAVPTAYAYWHAYVGNVIGTAGSSTTGNGWSFQSGTGTTGGTNIWDLGSDDATSSYDVELSGVSGSYYLRHINYDTVSATVHYDAGFPDHTLVNSFYLSGTPSFFGPGASNTYPFPWVTPQSGTLLQPNSGGGSGNPAKARWDAGTPLTQP